MIASPVGTDYLSILEVAEVCRVVPKTVRAWIRTGRLPGYMTPGGKVMLVRRSELETHVRRVGAR